MKRIAWTAAITIAALVAARIVAGVWMSRVYEGRLEALREAGEPLTLAEMAPPEVASERNAAVCYEEAFRQIDLLSDEEVNRVGELAGNEGPLSAEELSEGRALLDRLSGAMRLLREGARRPECRYDVDYRAPGFALRLPHLQKIRAAVRVMKLSAEIRLASGDADAAVDDCVVALALSRSAQQDPVLMAMLVETATTGLALRELEGVLDRSEPSATALERVPEALGEVRERDRFVQALRGERCAGLSLIQLAFTDPNRLIQIGSGRRLPGLVRFSVRIIAFLFKPVVILDSLDYLDVMDRFIVFSASPERYSSDPWRRMNDEIDESAYNRSLLHPVSRMILPTIRRVAKVYDHGVARKGCAKLAVGLRLYRLRHGHYPASLSELVPDFLDKLPADPFTGKDFIYRAQGAGFIVYSAGVNRTDEGGAGDQNTDVGDIAWKCSR
jgi:hypothetical protein